MVTVGGIIVNRSPEWQSLWGAIDELLHREGLAMDDMPLYDALVSDMGKPGWARTELAIDKMIQAMVNGEADAPKAPEQAVELMMSDQFAELYYWPNERWFEEALFDPPE